MSRALANFLPLAFVSLCVVATPVPALDHAVISDTFIDCQAATRDTNFGSADTVRVRNSALRIAYLGFANLPPADQGLAPIKLLVHVDTVNVPGQVQIREVSSLLFESTMTCNNRPSLGSTVWGTLNLTAADAGKVVSVDVTTLVQRWQQNTQVNRTLAIIATPTNPVQVYFTSREGGNPARLQFVDAAPPAGDNEATVAPSGADYTDVITAANNAYSGDRWCANPNSVPGCRINIAAGTYFLTEMLRLPRDVAINGASMSTTRLVTSPGIATAVLIDDEDGGSSVRDLTLVHRQRNVIGEPVMGLLMSDASAGLSLERFAISVTGGNDVTAVGAEGSVTVADCDIAAEGGGSVRVMALNAIGVGELTLTRSRIVASVLGGVSGEAIGVNFPNTGGNHLEMTDTDIVADGGRRAVGVIGPWHEETLVRITGGTIIARTAASAVGAVEAIGLFTGGQGGSLTGTRIIAQALQSAIGVRLRSRLPSSTIVIRNVQVEGSTTGLLLEDDGQYELTNVRARSSQGTAVLFLFVNHGPRHVMRDSFFEGPRAVVVNSGSENNVYEFHSTVLSGARELDPGNTEFGSGNVYRCTDVYDAEYRLLNGQCQ